MGAVCSGTKGHFLRAMETLSAADVTKVDNLRQALTAAKAEIGCALQSLDGVELDWVGYDNGIRVPGWMYVEVRRVHGETSKGLASALNWEVVTHYRASSEQSSWV
ncbi:hypothetical protein Pfra02_04280 [Pseudomonas fragi]|nr:hypothetical protein Pfra02_04280 [Pseudomonas fragi]